MDTVENIVERIKKGKHEDFAQIIQKYQKQLLAYCYHMLCNREDAEDVLQDIFLKAFLKLDSYRESISFSAWLYKIAYNNCINFINRNRLRNGLLYFLQSTKSNSYHNDSYSFDEEISPELHRALLKLSTEERNIVILRVLEEKSYEEISQVIGKTPSCLRKKYERAYKKLQNILNEKKGAEKIEPVSII